MNLNEKNIKAISDWIHDNCSTVRTIVPNNVKSKIDFLERALELLRINIKYLDNNLDFEEFIQGQIFLEDKRLKYTSPQNRLPLDSGTKPILLQPKLLMFLLLNHKKAFRIYDIIDNFIYEIWEQLKIVDFKKTKTGVTRCFTNTRFAANTLRDYGLLKFTKKEAFKTWTLSLYGFLVASKVIQNNPTWDLSSIDRKHSFDLHPDILKSSLDIKTYDDFVNRLAAICKPKIELELFNTFEDVLKEAYSILDGYWESTRNPNLSKKERQEESFNRIKKLETHPNIEEFYTEFSLCIYVDTYIEQLLGQQK